jgi:hypothetical protein
MTVKLYLMWGMWLGQVGYDIIVSNLGWFPDRTLAMRLSGDFDIAWFIGSIWILCLILRWESRALSSG